MTDVKYIHHQFKLKMNKLDTGSNYDIPPAFIDTILFEALNEYIEIFYSGNTKQYQLGFEVTQQRIDMLKDFVVAYPDIVPIIPISSVNYGNFKLQKFDFTPFAQKYKHFLKAEGKDSICSSIIPVTIEQLNNIDFALQGKFTKPSTKWKRVLGNIVKNSLFTYAENNITELYLTYLKTPIKPFFGGYDSLEYLQGDLTAPNNASPQINTELSIDYAHILVNIMIGIASSNISDFQKSQIYEQKIISI
jgi:hypothetical protein